MKNILYKYGDYYGKIAYFVELENSNNSILLNFNHEDYYKCVNAKIQPTCHRNPIDFKKIVLNCYWCDDEPFLIRGSRLRARSLTTSSDRLLSVMKNGILIITPSKILLYKTTIEKTPDLTIQLEDSSL